MVIALLANQDLTPILSKNRFICWWKGAFSRGHLYFCHRHTTTALNVQILNWFKINLSSLCFRSYFSHLVTRKLWWQDDNVWWTATLLDIGLSVMVGLIPASKDIWTVLRDKPSLWFIQTRQKGNCVRLKYNSQFTLHKLTQVCSGFAPGSPQDRPKFTNVNPPSPGLPWDRSSHGLGVGSTWSELRLPAV